MSGFHIHKDYYSTLGLPHTASADEIKRAYHRLAKQYHPDTTGGNMEATELFKELNEAYQVLSDPGKRAYYDSSKTGFSAIKIDFEPYLVASLERKKVKLNEEFEITFRYLGEGRIFKKPEVSALSYLSSPVVEHRMVRVGLSEVKETALTYTVCAVMQGELNIPQASIYINHKQLASETLSIAVDTNDCFFKKSQDADLHPYPVYLYKERTTVSTYRRTFIYRHTVLIPRSSYAYYYHQIGATLKFVFTLLGFIMAAVTDHSWIGGLLTGSITGSAVCYSMYWLTGVKPKFFYSLKYYTVTRHLEEGYKPGKDPAYGILADRFFYLLGGAFK